ncbi:hypothetical protein GPJ56_001904 [Histomonas meleagridis]|nr:hypothetical protein GPJ56_001904 [Histomonas meleagridis]
MLNLKNHTIKSTAKVVNHDVEVNHHLVKSMLKIVNHDVEVNHHLMKSTAEVTNHDVEVENHTIKSKAEVVSHNVVVNKERIDTEANVQELRIRIHKDVQTYDVKIPEVKINYKSVPKQLTISEALARKFNTKTTSSSETNDTYTSDDESDSSDSSDESNTNNNDNSDSDPFDDEETNEINYDELIEDVKKIETKQDVIDLINKWKNTANAPGWKHEGTHISQHPLLHIMLRENKWCYPGLYPCQCKCNKVLPSGSALRAHMDKEHVCITDKNHIYGCIKNCYRSKTYILKLMKMKIIRNIIQIILLFVLARDVNISPTPINLFCLTHGIP